jgi:hypothetical protein
MASITQETHLQIEWITKEVLVEVVQKYYLNQLELGRKC